MIRPCEQRGNTFYQRKSFWYIILVFSQTTIAATLYSRNQLKTEQWRIAWLGVRRSLMKGPVECCVIWSLIVCPSIWDLPKEENTSATWIMQRMKTNLQTYLLMSHLTPILPLRWCNIVSHNFTKVGWIFSAMRTWNFVVTQGLKAQTKNIKNIVS